MRIKFRLAVVSVVFLFIYLGAGGGATALSEPFRAQADLSAEYLFYTDFAIWAQENCFHSIQKNDLKHALYYSELNRQGLSEMERIVYRSDLSFVDKEKQIRELQIAKRGQQEFGDKLREWLNQILHVMCSDFQKNFVVRHISGAVSDERAYSLLLAKAWAYFIDSLNQRELPEAFFYHELCDQILFELRVIDARRPLCPDSEKSRVKLSICQRMIDSYNETMGYYFYLEMKWLTAVVESRQDK